MAEAFSINHFHISDLTILLVEPSATQLKVIIRHLTDEGVDKITGADSGQKTLEILKTYHPDLIISSMYLPDMTATELVTQIRQNDALRHIPFMLISSESSFERLDPIRQAGVVAILPKPFNHKDLYRALKSTLEFINPEELILDHFDVRELRVLVVDDSAMARKYVTKVLNDMGIMQITYAINGREGAEIFAQSNEAFDLVVTDYNMPEMDGQELVRYIRTERANSYIPILMVTSEENQTRLHNVQQSGVSAICDKPFEPGTVKDMLLRIL